MRMERVTEVNRVCKVEEVPAIDRLNSVVASEIEGINRDRTVGLTVDVVQHNAEGFL